VARRTIPGEKSREDIIPELIRRLRRAYPQARIALRFQNAFQLLAATILSAQCTDEQVNKVTPALFARYPDARALAAAKLGEVEKLIRSTGFFRHKARSLVGMSRELTSRFHNQVPRSLEELVTLPGVARKTANVVLAGAFGVSAGIVVDTHVKRLSQRLGLSRERTPEKIERDLMTRVPRRDWIRFPNLLIFHGRRICLARKPACERCPVQDLCPSAFRV